MKIPRSSQIDLVVQCCTQVDALSEILAKEAESLDRKARKALTKKALDRFDERFSKIRGNRSEGVPLTFADLRLLMTACLRDALKTLEEMPPERAA
jgi:hypothetical protein